MTWRRCQRRMAAWRMWQARRIENKTRILLLAAAYQRIKSWRKHGVAWQRVAAALAKNNGSGINSVAK